jgi:hypothetical protein
MCVRNDYTVKRGVLKPKKNLPRFEGRILLDQIFPARE